MDRIDNAILVAMQNDGRISNKELAAAVGLAPSSCLERVRRLQESGVITGFRADVNPAAVGIRLQAFVLALNWDIELARYHILKMDGPQALADLDPTYPEWHPLISPPGEPQGPMADRLASGSLNTTIGARGHARGTFVA